MTRIKLKELEKNIDNLSPTQLFYLQVTKSNGIREIIKYMLELASKINETKTIECRYPFGTISFTVKGRSSELNSKHKNNINVLE